MAHPQAHAVDAAHNAPQGGQAPAQGAQGTGRLRAFGAERQQVDCCIRNISLRIRQLLKDLERLIEDRYISEKDRAQALFEIISEADALTHKVEVSGWNATTVKTVLSGLSIICSLGSAAAGISPISLFSGSEELRKNWTSGFRLAGEGVFGGVKSLMQSGDEANRTLHKMQTTIQQMLMQQAEKNSNDSKQRQLQLEQTAKEFADEEQRIVQAICR